MNLLLYDSDLSNIYETGKILIRRELYKEAFRFSEIFKIEGKIFYEKWKSDVPVSVSWVINVQRNCIATYTSVTWIIKIYSIKNINAITVNIKKRWNDNGWIYK